VTDNPAGAFAEELRLALQAIDHRAVHLRVTARGPAAVIGIDEGDTWVPLLRLSRPSGSYNVMSVSVRHGGAWAPAFARGIPAKLAEDLTGPYMSFWAPEVDAVLAWRETCDHGH
jgi:hypothetical protein